MARHIEPRMLPKGEALYYAGFSPSSFASHKEELTATGFPAPHPITKKYDRKLLDEWMDRTGGYQSIETSEEQELLNRLKNGNI